VQWEADIIDGEYVKRPYVPEYNWVWSPQGLIAMHYPERWGYVFFSYQDPGDADYGIPASAAPREYLRQLYYAQKQHWMDRSRFAKSLRRLQAKSYFHLGKKLKPSIETTSQSYIITLKGKGIPTLHIREDGLLWETE